MKKTILMEAIDRIDDDLVEEAADIKRSHKRTWIRITSAAACIAIAAGTVALILLQPGNSKISNVSYQNLTAAAAKYPDRYGFDDYDAIERTIKENPVKDSLYSAMSLFGYKTAAQLLTSKDENMLYSPMSLYYALSLAAAGAKGETQDELLALLGMDDANALAAQCGNLYRVFYRDDTAARRQIANSLWLSNHFNGQPVTYKEKYLKTAVNDFYASLFSVDFSNKDTGKMMGEWVSENTNRTLSYDYTPNSQQMMSILNTVYYYSEWTSLFDEEKTKEDIFTLANGETVNCDFMNDSNGIYYSTGEGYIRSSLYTKSNERVTFVLPDEGADISELLSTPQKIKEIFTGGKNREGEVIWHIPKFSYNTTLEMGDALKGLGVVSAFKKDADFSGITDSKVFISDVKQKTRISIDEKGIEASAYTEIGYGLGGTPDDIAYMNLNRPFIYGIMSSDGILLFIGVCNNPLG